MENTEKDQEVVAEGVVVGDETVETVTNTDVPAPVATTQFRSEVMDHLDLSMEKIRSIFVMAVERIENLKTGEKIPATTLAEEIARHPSVNSTGAYLYPVLKNLINEKYPGVKIMRGAHGGILKL